MKQDVILVLDCGATNVRAMAVDRQGKIIARAATANASDIAAEKSDWHQWSLEAIMQRFADCCRQIHDQLASCTVRGITVTTFGVDGALVDEQGALLYPIISWKCPRTAAVMENISQYMPARQLQQIAGVGAFAFNTLYKLVWLKENHPQLLAQAHAWLFISSLINHRLTGEFTTDLTMAGTSQMLEWVRKLLWSADTPWQTLIDEAQAIPPGAQGVRMQCDLLASQHAGWQGVTLNTTRGHFYRAALEGLSDQLAQHLQTLEKIGGFRAKELLLVGGGSRNALWNQIKANRLGIPIKVLDDAETTVAGAAMFGWYGVGEFSSPEQARAQVAYRYRYFWPQTEPELIEEA